MTHTILAHILSLLTLVVAPAAADEVDAYVAGHHGKRAGLCDRIECTDEQRAKVDAIRDAHRQDAADERAEAKALREALKVERKKAEPNPEEIARLEAALDSVKAELRRDREASKAEIAALLTPEQRAELDAMKAERKAERERQIAERLARENARRSALGEPALKSVDDIKDPPDAILAEATQITADYVLLEPRLLAESKPPPK